MELAIEAIILEVAELEKQRKKPATSLNILTDNEIETGDFHSATILPCLCVLVQIRICPLPFLIQTSSCTVLSV